MKVYLQCLTLLLLSAQCLGEEASPCTCTGPPLPPKLTGPIINSENTFHFECEVCFLNQGSKPDVRVVWTIDGVPDSTIANVTLTGAQTVATLSWDIAKQFIHKRIGCQVYYDGTEVPGNPLNSNDILFGIQVSQDQLSISDSEGEKQFTVTSTIPVICEQGSESCCVNFTMSINKAYVVFIKGSCHQAICYSNWNRVTHRATFTVTVVPSRTAIASGTREATLNFDVTTSGSGHIIDLFKDFKINPLPISIKLEPGYACSLAGDPHITQFDFKGNVVDLYKVGDYIAYFVKNRDFMVQIRTWPCWAVTCICGVVVKEKNDIIKFHGCNTDQNLLLTEVETPYGVSDGTSVRRSKDNATFVVLLPSGSTVKIDIIQDVIMNVDIQTPAYDKAQAEGLCGTNDGDPANDFKHRDDNLTDVCSGPNSCIPESFTDSWKVTGTESMFVETPLKVEPDPPTEYCSCTVDVQDNLACSARTHIPDTGIGCPNCPVITKTLKPKVWNESNQDTYIPREAQPVDPNKQWPNDQALSEAKEKCMNGIRKANLYSKCQSLNILADLAVDECLGDMLFGGTDKTMPAIAASFTSKCQISLTQDEKNYVKGQDGQLILSPDIRDPTCPENCLQHGECVGDGTCQCLTGWEGPACQTSSDGPRIKFTTGSSMCSAVGELCKDVEIDTFNINHTKSLNCLIQMLDSQTNETGDQVMSSAINETESTIKCRLTPSVLSVQIYIIGVSLNMTPYGNTLKLYSFDSSCLRCDEATCQPLENYCLIGNVCYRNGVTNKNNEQEVCNVNVNPLAWSGPTTEPCPTT